MAKAGPRLTRSGVVDTEKGGGESFSDIRTSSGMFFDRGEVSLCNLSCATCGLTLEGRETSHVRMSAPAMFGQRSSLTGGR